MSVNLGLGALALLSIYLIIFCPWFCPFFCATRDRFPGLPPPPSEEDDWGFESRRRRAPQTRGIPCANVALKRRLYDLLDAAVKNAGR